MGDEFLNVAVSGEHRRLLRPVEKARFDLDLDHLRLPSCTKGWLSRKNTLAHHLRRGGEAELGQDRRRDVDERRRAGLDAAVGEEHAGHFERVGAMVGTPGRVVIQQNLLGQVAQTRRPRRAVATGVTNDQVRRQGRRISLVDLVRSIDARITRWPLPSVIDSRRSLSSTSSASRWSPGSTMPSRSRPFMFR